MSYIVIDCETTKFYNPKVSARSPLQARICSLAAIKLNDKLETEQELYSLIKPAGWIISKEASEKNGLTNEICEKEGRDIKEILTSYLDLFGDINLIVAHNIEFDSNMFDVEFKNAQISNPHNVGVSFLCTMDYCTDICRIPFAKKRNFGKKYKWPKLEEAYRYFFHQGYDGAHNALTDCTATAQIFKHLVSTNLYSLPIPIPQIGTPLA